jgi:CBS domain-containing protein
MVPVGQVRAIHPDTNLWSALDEMRQENLNQLAVMEDSQLVGVISQDAIMEFLRVRAELGA